MRKEEHEVALFRKARKHNSKLLRNKEHQFVLVRTFGTYKHTLIALQTCMLVREKTPIVKHVNIVLSCTFHNGSEPMLLDHQVVQFWTSWDHNTLLAACLPYKIVCGRGVIKCRVILLGVDEIPSVFAAGFKARCGMPPTRRRSSRQTRSFSTDIQDRLSRSCPSKPDIPGKCSQITQISLDPLEKTCSDN